MTAVASVPAPSAADALRWERRGAESASPESSAPERSHSAPPPEPPRKGGGRSRRRWIAGGGLAWVLASSLLVRCVPWGGPLVADGLRAVLGERPVAWLEERAAGLEDLWMGSVPRHSPPRPLPDASRRLRRRP